MSECLELSRTGKLCAGACLLLERIAELEAQVKKLKKKPKKNEERCSQRQDGKLPE